MKKILLSLLLVQSLFSDILVIVNPESKVASLDSDYTKMIFMKKINELDSGEVLIPIDQDSESDIYDDFYEAVANKSKSRMSKYWAKRSFSGKGEAPEVFESDAEVIRMIMNNINMVGYIHSDSLVDGVKVILSIKQ